MMDSPITTQPIRMTPPARKIRKKLLLLADAQTAVSVQRFFKPRVGESGDTFIGVRMPVMRQLVKEYQGISLEDVLSMLPADEHEVRIMALLLLVDQFQRGTAAEQCAVYQAYLQNTAYINNWDLVDCSAHLIVGKYLQERSRRPLHLLAKSEDLWERRIAIIATFTFIRNDDYPETIKIAERLLNDPEDLIHKATGWMLREVGKRDLNTAERFLKQHCQMMPRTMLRYAIERFPAEKRRRYMQK